MNGTKADRFRVIISGGGVAGLVLASALEVRPGLGFSGPELGRHADDADLTTERRH
jgi:hypothetical protein